MHDCNASPRRPTLLIVGCGDIGLRVLKRLAPRWRVLVLSSSPERAAGLRAAGAAMVLAGDLDQPHTLARLGGLADAVLHLAPPPATGVHDTRTAALLAALARRRPPTRLVYASTTGVYGDAGGALFDETRALRPAHPRAQRRADAEARVRLFGRRHGVTVSVLRVPGIYALDRDGGDPRERLRRGVPVLAASDDVVTNHIHADDLASACIAALHRGAPQRVYHVNDDSRALMGEHFDAVADASGLPRPPRVARAEAPAHFSPVQLSFLSESRRLDNTRLKRELGVRLAYPTTLDALREVSEHAPTDSEPPTERP